MKKTFLAALATGLFLVGMGGVANAALYVYDNGAYVDVGGYDDFLAQATKAQVGGNAGDAEELNWMNTTLLGMGLISQAYETDDYLKIPLASGTLTFPVYSETTTPTLTVALDSAFKLNGQPDYFLVKTGNNDTTPDYRWFLFDNKINLDYAVFLLQDPTEGYSIKNIAALSHGAQA